MDEAEMTARIIRAMENPWVDCIGHPTGRLVGQREPYAVNLDAVFKAAATLGVAMEISSDPSRLDLKDAHARRARDLGVKIIISTDAHWARQLGIIRHGVTTARRGWLETGDVLNTLPVSRMCSRLRRAARRTATEGEG
jgi:DNA polymerase (family 10)